GLKDEFLAEKPKFSEIAEEFLEFFKDATLVAHNAGFDMGFINSELKRINLDPIPDSLVVDTLALARRKHPMSPNSLDALCNRYGVDNSGRNLHGALLDSELLAEVYMEMTGGRQAALVLDRHGDEEAVTQGSKTAVRPRQARKTPLPGRLSAQADRLHREFVEKLGENALWSRYLGKQ
ncbi:MAG: exonuclease domain-containing protein, partial [Rhizobiaceae bacterium]